MADSIGKLNPMRYRSYYFDNETDYYYLQSRYYDPNIGRFINADEAGILELTKGQAVGHNLFAYCGNDPVNKVDPKGLRCALIIGFTVQGGGISGFFISFWLVHDSRGNSGILITVGIGLCTPQVSITWSPFFSWRKTIYNLTGISYVFGGGVDVGASIGVDCIFDSKGPAAIQLNIGIGLSPIAFDAHAYFCATYLIPIKFSTFNKLLKILKRSVKYFFKTRRIYR